MATNAQYLVFIGDDRIISFKNDGGTDIPKTLETTLGLNTPSIPTKGNRKITALVLVSLADPDADDQTLTLKVKVPAGIISGHIQKFDANSPQINYFPAVRVIPQTEECYNQRVVGTTEVGSENVAAQTVDVQITQLGNQTAELFVFLLELDWSHTIKN